MKNSAFFPLFVDISEKKIVVIGGGAIATRRVKTLLPFEPQIVVVAPEVTGELEELEPGFYPYQQRAYPCQS